MILYYFDTGMMHRIILTKYNLEFIVKINEDDREYGWKFTVHESYTVYTHKGYTA